MSIPTEDGQWEFLEDTYWYVPTAYLPAPALINTDPARIVNLVDQTLWRIETVYSNYVIGEVATTTGNGWVYSTLVGSITPDGSVSFSFTPQDTDGNLTVGQGTMKLIEGEWYFLMQMSTGSGEASITHWAYMAEVAPGDRAWDVLPGYPNTGVEAAFDDDPNNDLGSAQPQRLIFGTNGNDSLTAPGRRGLLLFGEGGDDVLGGRAGVDGLVGGAGDDRLLGRGAGDDLYGQSGNDVLEGGAGADYLDGGLGNDRLIGGLGADILVDGHGGDVLRGGRGADRFAFTSPDGDVIVDFTSADVLDLSGVDAMADHAGNDAFTFIGSAAFTGREGELRYAIVGGNTFIQGDVQGDGLANFGIALVGRHVLTADDFVL